MHFSLGNPLKKLAPLLLLCALAQPVSAQISASIRPKQMRYVQQCSIDETTVRISFLDVGQGDASLISCPGNIEHVLIDAGTSPERYPDASRLFHDALQARLGADSRLRYAILSHPHPDHSFGFLSLLEAQRQKELQIETYIDTASDDLHSQIEEQIREETGKLGISYQRLDPLKPLSLSACEDSGTEVRLHLSTAAGEIARQLGCPQNLNDCSIVTYLEVAGQRFAFMGDATRNWEQLMLHTQPEVLPPQVQVLKVGHHGNAASSEAFLRAIDPLFAVISSGKAHLGSTRSGGYPSTQSIRALKTVLRKKLANRAVPEYEIASCRKSKEKESCHWTNSVVASTLLSTASLGNIDFFAKEGVLCVQAERLSTGIHISF